MAKQRNNYYVVWQGKKTGIFDSWAECQKQVAGFTGAKFKGFVTLPEARKAYQGASSNYIGRKNPAAVATGKGATAVQPVWDSISVDAACQGNPGRMEYRGVDTKTGCVLFQEGPFEDGTNNVGEFLAIVHALSLLSRRSDLRPIYTDSRTALSWIRKKRANTKLARTARNRTLFERIERAERWLVENQFSNRILKWNTVSWGEIRADYGRK